MRRFQSTPERENYTKPEFVAINPNAKLPAIVDGDVTVFDSNAILLYLAEKTGKFPPPKGDKARGELLPWLMFVATGVGPYSGQSVDFRNFAPDKIEYAINRYAFEAQRHFAILDARLAGQKYMLGDTYTIVDMDAWGWARLVPTLLGESTWVKFPNLKRLVEKLANDRPHNVLWRSRTGINSRPRWMTSREKRSSVT
jgi:GSH-dependent disulfide-bond oxidoreductase